MPGPIHLPCHCRSHEVQRLTWIAVLWMILLAPVTADDLSGPVQSGFQPLIQGNSLQGWTNVYPWGKAEVIDGEVHLSSDRKFFLVTERTYGDFVFEGEVLLPPGKANSGIMFRAQVGPKRVFGYQAEVDGDPGRGWSGGLYDEGRRMWFASPIKGNPESERAFRQRAADTFRRNEWNRYRITCQGRRIRIEVNGVTTTDVEDDRDLRGVIGLQHHGEKGQVYRFRNLRIRELDPSEPTPDASEQPVRR